MLCSRLSGVKTAVVGILLMAFAISMVVGVASPAFAQESDGAISVNVAIPPGHPTEVVIGFGVFDIPRIDEREQLFEVDGRLFALWIDPALEFDPDLVGFDNLLYEGEAAKEMLKTEIWSPGFELFDGLGGRQTRGIAVTIQSDGTVLYEERFVATVSQSYQLQDFPFDDHVISFRIEPFAQDTSRVTFTSVSAYFESLGLAPVDLDFSWESDEWDFNGEDFTPTIDNDMDDGFATATFEIPIERKSGFYVTNVILPLLLIVAISWAVFWMDFEDMSLADRLTVSVTSLLTVVAFDFVTSDSLPKLPYATRLDSLYTISYLFLALTVLASVVAHKRHHRGDNGDSKLDRLGRRFVPATYLVVVAMVLGGVIG